MTTTNKAVLAIAAVTVLGGILRFSDLGRPDRKYFDEVYYASDACWYAGIPFERCDLERDQERSWVHPPLGKEVLSWGIDAPGALPGFGNRPLGWRVVSAAAGTATVAVVGLLAFLLFRRAVWAGVAGLLLATESLHLVQSRISMLDGLLTFFVALGSLLLVADRRTNESRPGEGSPAPPPAEVDPEQRRAESPGLLRLGGVRPLRLLAGAALGAAVAVKWSGLFALAGAALLSIGWSIAAAARRRRHPEGRDAAGRGFAAEAVGQLLAFMVVPAAVYLAAWIPWLADRSFDLGELVRHHLAMFDYHAHLEAFKSNGEPIHPYLSPAWSWFLLARPVAYFWRGEPSCCTEILGIGNPLLFWGALIYLPYLAVAWFSRRDWRAGAILAPVLAQYLPWLLVSRPLFLFYMTPLTPFLALGLTYAVRDLAVARFPTPRLAAAAAAVVVAVSVGLFVFFWPVLSGEHLTHPAWSARMWIYVPDTVFNWI